jgi:uncharacterized protein YdaU (DUF1376 family)
MARPWFPFYVGDYVRDTARLTTEAHGAYLLLMLDYWVNGAPPDDDETLATITKLPVSIWKKRRPMLVKFFTVKDGVWLHGRIEKEKNKAETVGASNSEKAREAAERRWAKQREDERLASTEQCSDDAPSIAGALLQNAQSQPQSPSKPDSKKGESPSPSNLKLVGEGEEVAVFINETYEPSDRAIEYAFSLGMKKADLNAELSKFIATSMAARVKSYNPDMSFKVWCDRWLEFKLRKDPNWRPVPEAAPVPQRVYVLVIQGTLEASCWAQYNKERRLRPLFFCKQLLDGAEVIAARCDTLFPPGYDEATGEKLAPSSDEAAA